MQFRILHFYNVSKAKSPCWKSTFRFLVVQRPIMVSSVVNEYIIEVQNIVFAISFLQYRFFLYQEDKTCTMHTNTFPMCSKT